MKRHLVLCMDSLRHLLSVTCRSVHMDYKAEIIRLIEQIEGTWLLKIVYEVVVNIVKP